MQSFEDRAIFFQFLLLLFIWTLCSVLSQFLMSVWRLAKANKH